MANQYIYQLTDSWTDANTAYNAIQMTVVDSASAAASNLLTLRTTPTVGGTVTTRLTVSKTGVISNGALSNLSISTQTSGYAVIVNNGLLAYDTLIRLPGTEAGSIRFSLNSQDSSILQSDAAAAIAQRNGTNAQTFRVYNTSTSSNTNYERAKIAWESDILRIGTEKGGTGSARALEFQTDGVTRLTVSATSAGLTIGSGGSIGISGSSSIMTGSYIRALDFSIETDTPLLRMGASSDVRLTRDAAAILAQRNGTNAQTFRVYKTFTDASNYERTEIAHATYSSAEYCILRAATAGTGADNLNLVLSPAGTGGVMAHLPDGTTTGGNARGNYAVDFQTERSSATQVASAIGSAILGGIRNTASNSYSVSLAGRDNASTGQYAIVGGYSSTSSGTASVALGQQTTASGNFSVAIGYLPTANKYGQFALASGYFAATGDAQRSTMVLRNATTDATATELFLDGSSARATIPNNTCWHADIRIVGRQSTGANHATYHRKCTIYKNTTAGSTTLVGTVQTIGTDEESDANWAVAVTADTTNGSLKIEVTGVAATNIRWVAELSVVEVAYA